MCPLYPHRQPPSTREDPIGSRCCRLATTLMCRRSALCARLRAASAGALGPIISASSVKLQVPVTARYGLFWSDVRGS